MLGHQTPELMTRELSVTRARAVLVPGGQDRVDGEDRERRGRGTRCVDNAFQNVGCGGGCRGFCKNPDRSELVE